MCVCYSLKTYCTVCLCTLKDNWGGGVSRGEHRLWKESVAETLEVSSRLPNETVVLATVMNTSSVRPFKNSPSEAHHYLIGSVCISTQT